VYNVYFASKEQPFLRPAGTTSTNPPAGIVAVPGRPKLHGGTGILVGSTHTPNRGTQSEGKAGARLLPDPVKEHSTCVSMILLSEKDYIQSLSLSLGGAYFYF
jgi:hypothetical protein